MNVVQKKMDEIHNAYAKFREENADLPTHFIMGIEARQAIKASAHPVTTPVKEIKTYLGITVIPLEKAVIIE